MDGRTPHAQMLGRPGEPCPSCGAPLAVDQRYCLECGGRRGAPRVEWHTLLTPLPPPGPRAADPVAAAAAVGLDTRLPTARVTAALVLVTLAFGVAVGAAAGPGADTAGAGGRPNLTILVQAPPPAPPPVAPAAPPEAPPASDTPAPQAPQAPVDTSTPADTAAPAGTPAPADTTAPSSGGDQPTTDTPVTPEAAPKVPPVKHVWLVVLHGRSFDQTFGDPAAAPYLAGELRAKGTLLPWYHATSHEPDAGGVALLSGQRHGSGPFDAKVQTLPDQLTGAGRTWKAYLEGVEPGKSGCDQPPFSRFASITQSPECGPSVAGLDRLAPDLADAESAPAFSYIALPGEAGDDARLHETVQPILDSKAYADGGLVVVTFDEGRPDDAEAGGGRVGALLLSPYVTPGATIEAPYDHFTLLRSIEDLFSLEPLGYAKDTRLKPFGPRVYGAWTP